MDLNSILHIPMSNMAYFSSLYNLTVILRAKKDDLKDKVLYNYDDLSYVSITITTSRSNIETLKNNTILEQNKYEEEMELESYYMNEINRLEEENYNKDETISELEEKIAELEERLNDISSIVE